MYMSFLGEVKTSPVFPVILVRLCCLSFFLFDLFYHTYRIGCMYPKENPKYFRFPVSSFYPDQWVMLFLCSKTSFQAGSSFTAEFRPQDLTKRLIFGGSALTLKGSTYMIFCTKFPVGIIGIDWIRRKRLNPNLGQLLQMDTVFQTYSFVKSLERDMLYERDSVYLYIVDFGSEFNGFGFLASDNGAKVMPVKQM